MEKAYLILSDGSVFEGQRLGAAGGKAEGDPDASAFKEILFESAVVGYMETLSDPRYRDKIAVQTFPLIGNYGAIGEEAGGRLPAVSGYVCREVCEAPSNFRMESTLADYLLQNNVVGIQGVDTRALRIKARKAGSLLGFIASGKPAQKYLDGVANNAGITRRVDKP